MPRQNRVTPRSELIAVEARGTFTGNRGCLHDDAGQIRRRWDGRRWITCELRFKDRKARLMEPGLYTHLFFLDEATALAAGHRPCGECRRPAFNAFLAAWTAGNPNAAPEGRIRIDALDRVLHAERTGPHPRVALDDLPDGTIVSMDGDPQPYLVLGDALLAWRPEGYAPPLPRPSAIVEVLTPRSTVNALRAGYQPRLHDSARVGTGIPVSGAGASARHGFASEVMAAAERMVGFGAPWCVGGGWAVDLYLGRLTRPHADVDLVILRGDQQRLHAHLAGWRLQRVLAGAFGDWPAGERLDPPVHEIHARSPDGIILEFLLNDHGADEWIFRRDPAVRCPLREVILPSAIGVPVLCPAVVLLYKAKAPRPADEQDFQQLRPALPDRQRRWLRAALARVHPGHPWIAQL